MTASASDPAVLVVDDEPASVNLLRITLGIDYPVYTATDGADGAPACSPSTPRSRSRSSTSACPA